MALVFGLAIEIYVDNSIKIDSEIKNMIWETLKRTGLAQFTSIDELVFISTDIEKFNSKNNNDNSFLHLTRDDVYDNSWAVIIGINEYTNISDLDYAVNDAKAVKNMLVNDFRNLPIMMDTGYPVCFDATHSVQMPTSMGNVSGGQREFIPHLARAAAACGIHALFMEVHDDPANALSDQNTVLDLRLLEKILAQAVEIHNRRLELVDKWGEDDINEK